MVSTDPGYESLRSLSDIQSVRDLDLDSVRDILRQHKKDPELEIVEMGKVKDMSGLNDAFNSTICSLKVKIKSAAKGKNGEELEPNNDVEEINFVIKNPPKMNFIRLVHKLSRPFFNEVSWYKDLVPQCELANGAGTFDAILPTCYHAHSSVYAAREGDSDRCSRICPWFCLLAIRPSESGVLILENVKHRQGQSFSMIDKRLPLPLQHVTLIFKELAHFHGKWMKWIKMAKENTLPTDKDVKPITLDTFKATYDTQKRIPRFLYKQLKNVAKKTVIKILKDKGPEEEENIGKCRRFFDRTAMSLLTTYMTMEPTEVFTLCHGDFWSNNILFAYDENDANESGEITAETVSKPETRTPKEMIMIDFQLINYGHPAYDLVYFVYLNTDLEFRNAHLTQVLRTYHDVFKNYMHECYPDFQYDFDKFKAEFDFHKPLGFTTACSVMPNVLSSCQLDLENTGLLALRELQRKQAHELDDQDNPSSKEIRRRIVEMVHEMARDGVL